MKNLCKSVLGLWVIGMGLGVSAPAQAASGVGPYYAMPAWDQKLDTATRFIVLTNWGSAAVLDRETGLVWEKTPSISDSTAPIGAGGWLNRINRCPDLEVGGRKGWRVPTIQELASLVDTSQANPSLPLGHPFVNVQSPSSGSSNFYWSVSTSAASTSSAWTVRLIDGVMALNGKLTATGFVWCVRGGQGVDPQ